eukprot:jgi/Pico_ML_1/54317/g4683.t1
MWGKKKTKSRAEATRRLINAELHVESLEDTHNVLIAAVLSECVYKDGVEHAMEMMESFKKGFQGLAPLLHVQACLGTSKHKYLVGESEASVFVAFIDRRGDGEAPGFLVKRSDRFQGFQKALVPFRVHGERLDFCNRVEIFAGQTRCPHVVSETRPGILAGKVKLDPKAVPALLADAVLVVVMSGPWMSGGNLPARLAQGGTSTYIRAAHWASVPVVVAHVEPASSPEARAAFPSPGNVGEAVHVRLHRSVSVEGADASWDVDDLAQLGRLLRLNLDVSLPSKL